MIDWTLLLLVFIGGLLAAEGVIHVFNRIRKARQRRRAFARFRRYL